MRRCGIAAGVVLFAAWCVAHALVSLLIWVIFAIPFGVLLALDALSDEQAVYPARAIVPPAPPGQPVVWQPERLAS